eukprot:972528-Amphidinium_carterae.1
MPAGSIALSGNGRAFSRLCWLGAVSGPSVDGAHSSLSKPHMSLRVLVFWIHNHKYGNHKSQCGGIVCGFVCGEFWGGFSTVHWYTENQRFDAQSKTRVSGRSANPSQNPSHICSV